MMRALERPSAGGGQPYGAVQRSGGYLALATYITAALCVTELVIGVRFNSTVVLADALHAYTVAGGFFIGVCVARSDGASGARRSGDARPEVIAALFVGLSLSLAVVALFVMAFTHLRLSVFPNAETYFAIAAGSATVKATALVLFLAHRRRFGGTLGEFWSTPAIFIGSALVAGAGVAATLTPAVFVDPLLGAGLALLLLWAASSLVDGSLTALSRVSPDIAEAISEALHDADGVVDPGQSAVDVRRPARPAAPTPHRD